MNDQITLAGFEAIDQNERMFLQSIRPQMELAVESNGGSRDLLNIKVTTPINARSSGYTVVKFGNFTSFRLKLRGKSHYISVPAIFEDIIPASYPQKINTSATKYILIRVTENNPAESYIPFLIALVGETVNRYPKEWDCCSRYEECSNAKTCTHPDKAFALSCGYRRILNSGKIFYGENRNI